MYEKLEKIALILYLIIFIALLLFLIILNNNVLIFYSFFIFVILGILISREKNYTLLCFGFSIALIFGSSVVYVGLLTTTYILFTLITYPIYLIFFSRSHIERISIFVILFLPIVLYYINATSIPHLIINTAIIGYYLLISSTISSFLKAYNESNGPHKRRIITMGFPFSKNRQIITLLYIISATVILITPIWPIGMNASIAGQPYVLLSIQNISKRISTPNLTNINYSDIYYISVNLSRYRYIINPGFSNIRFAYQNNTQIPALLVSTAYPQRFILKLKDITNYYKIKLYFMPYGTTYASMFTIYSPNIGVQINNISKVANATPGHLMNAGIYINKTVSYNGRAFENETEHLKYNIGPDAYITDTFCGYDKYVSMNSTGIVSVFASYNLSSSLPANPSMPTSQLYNYYISELPRYSYLSELNITHLNNQYLYYSGCTYYTILAPKPTLVVLNYSYKYYVTVSYATTLSLPASIAKLPSFSTGFFPQSIEYLVEYYVNETANTHSIWNQTQSTH